jgi:hypothetical protein
MSRDWRTDAAVAEEFFGLLGATVDQRLERIAETARAVLASLKTGTCQHKPAAIHRWTARHLDLCARTFCRPPPVELLELNEYLLGADKPERSTRKNLEKFIAAAHYVAQHPKATPAKIARAIEYDQKRIIALWLEDQEFREIVGIKSLRLTSQQKKGT